MSDNEKNFGSDFRGLPRKNESAPRARNRTVMLTPEITGQVRARLANEMERPEPVQDAVPEEESFVTPIPRAKSADGRSFDERPDVVDAEMEPAATIMMGPVSHAQPAPVRNEPVVEEVSSAGNADMQWAKKTPIAGFMVSYDQDPAGEVFELRSGRLIVTSEPTPGNVLFIEDESVSPMHAILRISESGEIQVLDQLSERGTKITGLDPTQVLELSGEKGELRHGDIISFGDRHFHVCLLAKRR